VCAAPVTTAEALGEVLNKKPTPPEPPVILPEPEEEE
jgi:hypothetical protein